MSCGLKYSDAGAAADCGLPAARSASGSFLSCSASDFCLSCSFTTAGAPDTTFDGDGAVTFWTVGRLAYATFTTVETPSVLVFGTQQRSVPLRRSDAYPDYYELEGITSSEVEQFLERRHRSPRDFPLAWN